MLATNLISVRIWAMTSIAENHIATPGSSEMETDTGVYNSSVVTLAMMVWPAFP